MEAHVERGQVISSQCAAPSAPCAARSLTPSALPSARDFIKRLLTLDASVRPTATEAMDDVWFTMATADHVRLESEIGSRLETFVSMAKLKKHALQVIAEHLTEAEIRDIKAIFH